MPRFIFKRVDLSDTELMEKIYRLRFQVYGQECGFIDQALYPSGLETDEYDRQSLHFAAIAPDGEVVGTTRMILTDDRISPLEKYCPQIPLDQRVAPGRVAEISRLAISKEVLKKHNDPFVKMGTKQPGFFQQTCIALGLYRAMYNESLRRGITHWTALMEKGLWFLLKIYGLKFECLGEEVDCFGPVKPYIGRICDIEKQKALENPELGINHFHSDVTLELHSLHSIPIVEASLAGS